MARERSKSDLSKGRSRLKDALQYLGAAEMLPTLSEICAENAALREQRLEKEKLHPLTRAKYERARHHFAMWSERFRRIAEEEAKHGSVERRSLRDGGGEEETS
jgi:hypothetical protein